MADFREVNKRIVRTPWPIPKICNVLQELEGFTFVTLIDLNIGYWTTCLDPDAQKTCTIILPLGKYSYMRLPMGVAGSPVIFQEKMSDLMQALCNLCGRPSGQNQSGVKTTKRSKTARQRA